MEEFTTKGMEFLEPLNERQTVFLTRNPHNGLILTARQLTAAQTQPYRQMQGRRLAHVPQVRAIHQDTENQFLVYSDYIPGMTLEAHLAQNGPLEPPAAIRLAVQLCEALEDLQKCGIIHRDVKPTNVIVTEQGQAYLIDFDISRLEKQGQNRDTRMLGTVGYAPPEQFGFRQTDCRADLYSLGVLLNVMVTGAFPDEKRVSGTLGKIIDRCTRMDPADRYDSPAALRQALAALLPKKPPATRRLKGIPGFRSGNVVFETVAMLVYLVAALFFILTFAVAFESLSNFVVVFFLWAVVLGWYFFAFDCFGVRSRCMPLESLRGRASYLPGALFCMVLWLAVWFGATGTALAALAGLPK